MIMSRRIPPPTAEHTPTNTAGTSGMPSASALLVAEGAEQPDDERVQPHDDGIEAPEEVGQQHPDQCRACRRQQIPVALQGRRA